LTYHPQALTLAERCVDPLYTSDCELLLAAADVRAKLKAAQRPARDASCGKSAASAAGAHAPMCEIAVIADVIVRQL